MLIARKLVGILTFHFISLVNCYIMIFQPNLIVNVVEPADGGNATPFCLVRHDIGPHKFPLTTSMNNSLFVAQFSGKEPFSGPVKKLDFLQLGNTEAPDMTPYASTCRSIEFSGHVSSTRLAFDIISQLPKVTKVAFLIGESQQYTYAESFTEFFSKTPVCRSVRKLQIQMDLKYFHSFYHDCYCVSKCDGSCLNVIQYSLVCLAESLLKHAADSFPNLKDLIVELPDDDRLCHAVQSLIQNCPALRMKTKTKVQNVPSASAGTDFSPPSPAMFYDNQYQNDQNSKPWTILDHPVNYGSLPEVSSHSESSLSNNSNNSPHEIPVHGAYNPQFSCAPVDQSSTEVDVINRPPPGFAPLPGHGHAHTLEVAPCESSSVNFDVHQRVNKWLSSLEI